MNSTLSVETEITSESATRSLSIPPICKLDLFIVLPSQFAMTRNDEKIGAHGRGFPLLELFPTTQIVGPRRCPIGQSSRSPLSVRTAQQVLGHSSAQTTLTYYVQSVEESQRSAITRLEKIMFPSVPKFENSSQLSN
jgi:hypothetical protein